MADLSIFHEMPDKSPTSFHGELMGFLTELHKLFEPYHPELHYMRGPGPKWHAKHTACLPGPASPAPDAWFDSHCEAAHIHPRQAGASFAR